MAVILDASEQTHRNEMYDQYKAHRPPPPEDLVPQFPLIRVATRAFSIPCIEEAGLEADDIIACYVTAAAKAAGWKVTIVSSDKDLMQLIDEDAGIDMLDTMNDRRIGRERGAREVRRAAGEGRRRARADGRQRRQCAGRAGDRAEDRDPADPAHTATSRRCSPRPTQITKPKLKQSLIDHADDARLSRELVRLVCDAPLPEPLEELALKGIPPEPLQAFLEDQGFKSLLNRLIGGGAAAGRSSSGGGINDVMAAMEPKRAGRRRARADRRRPLEI